MQSDDSTKTGLVCLRAVYVYAWRRASDLCSFGTVCCLLEMALARYIQTCRVFQTHSDTLGALQMRQYVLRLLRSLWHPQADFDNRNVRL